MVTHGICGIRKSQNLSAKATCTSQECKQTFSKDMSGCPLKRGKLIVQLYCHLNADVKKPYTSQQGRQRRGKN